MTKQIKSTTHITLPQTCEIIYLCAYTEELAEYCHSVGGREAYML